MPSASMHRGDYSARLECHVDLLAGLGARSDPQSPRELLPGVLTSEKPALVPRVGSCVHGSKTQSSLLSHFSHDRKRSSKTSTRRPGWPRRRRVQATSSRRACRQPQSLHGSHRFPLRRLLIHRPPFNTALPLTPAAINTHHRRLHGSCPCYSTRCLQFHPEGSSHRQPCLPAPASPWGLQTIRSLSIAHPSMQRKSRTFWRRYYRLHLGPDPLGDSDPSEWLAVYGHCQLPPVRNPPRCLRMRGFKALGLRHCRRSKPCSLSPEEPSYGSKRLGDTSVGRSPDESFFLSLAPSSGPHHDHPSL